MKISILSDNVKCSEETVKDMAELGKVITDPFMHAWSPSVFTTQYRSLANFISMELIALDVDEGLSLDEACKVFKDYQHVIGTSRSHQKEKAMPSGKTKPACDRYRIVLRLSKPITDQDTYYATYQSLRTRFPFIDPVCNNADRMFYPCLEVVQGDNKGAVVDPVAPPPKVEKVKRELSDEQKGKLARHTLEFITLGVSTDRHKALFKAARDFQEQGYDEAEALEKLMLSPTCGEPGMEPAEFEKQVAKIYKKEPKYEPRGLGEGGPPDVLDVVAVSRPADSAPEKNCGSLSSIELLEEALAHLANPEAVKGISTGWKEVDHLLGGLRQAELGIIQAYPKSGKTVLLTNMMTNLTAQGHKVGFASLEMHPAKQVEPDLYSILLKKDIRQGAISDEDKNRIIQLLGQGRGFTYFKRDRRPTVEEVCDWARRGYQDQGIRFFFFDHFHKFVQDESSVSSIAKTMTALTGLKYECPEMFMCLIVQPTKENRGRDNLADRVGKNSLRGGAVIFDECDWLINMHTKYRTVRIVESSWGDKRQDIVVSYPSDIRELEFEAIRAKPFSENMGKVIYMKYDKGTTEMKPFKWIAPEPERIEQEEREDRGHRRPQQSYPQGQQSGWAKDTWGRKKI